MIQTGPSADILVRTHSDIHAPPALGWDPAVEALTFDLPTQEPTGACTVSGAPEDLLALLRWDPLALSELTVASDGLTLGGVPPCGDFVLLSAGCTEPMPGVTGQVILEDDTWGNLAVAFEDGCWVERTDDFEDHVPTAALSGGLPQFLRLLTQRESVADQLLQGRISAGLTALSQLDWMVGQPLWSQRASQFDQCLSPLVVAMLSLRASRDLAADFEAKVDLLVELPAPPRP